ncbi:MAG: hypothetical protein IJO61_04550 [Oscillospiraceae bacterium]|nr:hypothetical protein [Oscillospiraceae bacterium]
MTPEKAIACIDEVLISTVNFDESLEYELSSYDIDWLEKAREALEARTKKKPENRYTEDTTYGTERVEFGSCPSCGSEVQEGMKCCMECGQALDWGDNG